MAYCTNCGNQIDPGRFCPHCGAKQQTEIPMASQAPSSGPSQTSPSDPYRPAVQENEPKHAAQQADETQFPMKWHKFMIYFALWLNALVNVVDGVACCSYISVTGVVLLFAVVYFALAAFAVYARFQLAKFCKGAPKKLLIYLLCNFALSVVVAAVTGTLANSAGSFVVVGVWLVWNWRYYNSREELFVN